MSFWGRRNKNDPVGKTKLQIPDETQLQGINEVPLILEMLHELGIKQLYSFPGIRHLEGTKGHAGVFVARVCRVLS